jgi:hypothetical protein
MGFSRVLRPLHRLTLAVIFIGKDKNKFVKQIGIT